jgi:hypothetical protein
MRKALLPMIAVLLLCGAATIALVATNARAAQDGRKPMMIALMAPDMARRTMAAPPAEAGAGQGVIRENRPGNRLSREQFCRDLYARKVGEMAFLEAKLALDAKQVPLFARWKQASLDIAKQAQNDCSNAGRPQNVREHRPSVVDRMAMEENLLKKRLADIEAERPALTALYNALTQAQKAELTRAGMRRMEGRMHMMLSMLDHPGMGMMRPGPMNGPQDGPMGGPPEPPPAR